jgi:hypothetical protein
MPDTAPWCSHSTLRGCVSAPDENSPKVPIENSPGGLT